MSVSEGSTYKFVKQDAGRIEMRCLKQTLFRPRQDIPHVRLTYFDLSCRTRLALSLC